MSIEEFYHLCLSLLKTPGTKMNTAYFEVDPFTINDLHLVNIFNAIISTSDAKPSKKKVMLRKLKKPKHRDKNEERSGKITYADKKTKFSRIKIAQADDKSDD